MTPHRRRALGASIAFVACLNVSLNADAAPRPVYAPSGGFAAPSVESRNSQFYGMSTGSLVPSAQGNVATGPWTAEGPALTSKHSWATGGGMWAPDLERISAAEWVLYFAAPVDGLDANQRCIGAATASSPLGPFTPVSGGPLACPGLADVSTADDRQWGPPRHVRGRARLGLQ
ncbi:glycoside hydrolase family protein [Hyalangium gracile]|uniref:hypothetical protein n=1 Tax=Hyalangium gracile TaxID=394092 RepID=UPI001CC9CDD4|nr:hypothetical protein [Hyalangium gracile]